LELGGDFDVGEFAVLGGRVNENESEEGRGWERDCVYL
jgi:hypothetical protein